MLTCVYCHGEINSLDCLITEIGNLHFGCADAALNFTMPQYMNPSMHEIDVACRLWVKRNK